LQAQQQQCQQQEQQEIGRSPGQGTEEQQELDAADAAVVDAAAHTVHDQTWPKQHCNALELLQARINEYGQHSSSGGSEGSSILQLEPELLVSGASAAAECSAYEYDEEEEVWRMLPDAVFVDVYDRLPPAAQG
jgi:hypothetical protein